MILVTSAGAKLAGRGVDGKVLSKYAAARVPTRVQMHCNAMQPDKFPFMWPEAPRLSLGSGTMFRTLRPLNACLDVCQVCELIAACPAAAGVRCGRHPAEIT